MADPSQLMIMLELREKTAANYALLARNLMQRPTESGAGRPDDLD